MVRAWYVVDMETTYQAVHDEAMHDYDRLAFERPDERDFIDRKGVSAAQVPSDFDWDPDAAF